MSDVQLKVKKVLWDHSGDEIEEIILEESEAEKLRGLRGDKGEAGSQGQVGPKGDKGDPGENAVIEIGEAYRANIDTSRVFMRELTIAGETFQILALN